MIYINLETLRQIELDALKDEIFQHDDGAPVTGEMIAAAGYVELRYDVQPEVTGWDYVFCGDIRIEGTTATQGWLVYSAPPAPEPTLEEITKRYELVIQDHLDGAALARGYDSINTVISYAEEPAVPKFQADGKRFRTWRSLVWAYAYEQLALVNSGGRTQPTVAEFLAELPVLAVSA